MQDPHRHFDPSLFTFPFEAVAFDADHVGFDEVFKEKAVDFLERHFDGAQLVFKSVRGDERRVALCKMKVVFEVFGGIKARDARGAAVAAGLDDQSAAGEFFLKGFEKNGGSGVGFEAVERVDDLAGREDAVGFQAFERLDGRVLVHAQARGFFARAVELQPLVREHFLQGSIFAHAAVQPDEDEGVLFPAFL